jgi:hypothetical protein
MPTNVNKQNANMWHKAYRHVGKADAVALLATAGAGSPTVADVLSGIVLRDCAGGSRTDTLPTAAALVAAMSGEEIGDIIPVLYINASDAAETITIAAGSGGAFVTGTQSGQKDIAQGASKLILIRLTAVVAGSEAYVVYM